MLILSFLIAIRWVDMDKKAAIFKALAEPNRLKMLEMIREEPGVCACKLVGAFSVSQPTLSYHMKMLADAGLITAEKNGRWMNYSLRKEGWDEIGRYIDSMR